MTKEDYLRWATVEWKLRMEGIELVKGGAATLIEVQAETKRRREAINIEAGETMTLIGINSDDPIIRARGFNLADILAQRDAGRRERKLAELDALFDMPQT